jgi:hypothetical protein
MVEKKKPGEARQLAVRDPALRPPLTDPTLAQRRGLILTAFLAILLTTLRIGTVPWLKPAVQACSLDTGFNRTILYGALTAALLYFLIAFLYYAWHDYQRWKYAEMLRFLDEYFEPIKAARGAIDHLQLDVTTLQLNVTTLHHTITKMNGSGHETDRAADAAAEFMKRMDHFDAAAKSMDDVLRRIKANAARAERQQRFLKRMQRVRAWLLDIGFPVLLGIIAFSKLAVFLYPFLSAAAQP